MKFSEFLINEDDLTRGMAKTRQAIGGLGGSTAKAAGAIQKAAAGERVTGTEAGAIQPLMKQVAEILSNPQQAAIFSRLIAKYHKLATKGQVQADQQQAAAQGQPVPGQGAEQVNAATR